MQNPQKKMIKTKNRMVFSIHPNKILWNNQKIYRCVYNVCRFGKFFN